MSTNASMATLRRQVIEELKNARLDPARYNVTGIARDAYVTGNGSMETWQAAVEKNLYPYLPGDVVRVVVEINGFQEHMYGTVRDFRTADNRMYRRRILTPHSAYVELFERFSGALRPLTEITPEIHDFEIVTDHSEVHRDGPQHNYGLFTCRSGNHGPYPPPAHVLVIHKASGEKRRLCDGCNAPEIRANLGHEVWRYRQHSKDTIRRLIDNPQEIAGPIDDHEARGMRDWADVFPYLVPAEAAAIYTQWKEQHNVRVNA
ncbi:hypothetical protein AB0M10_15215 [Streptomyces sp. NPDC051840]|uniref:hypothetical protein n=1 Tax=Streptomyces sp. NPDC051840 TaxID=3154752 RepID=UPI003419F24B